MTLGQAQQPLQQSLDFGVPSSSTSSSWDVTDVLLPVPQAVDAYQSWPNGPCRLVYSDTSDEVRRHTSGWAMRNTNNHNARVLKKSCLGVLLCSAGCSVSRGEGSKQICLRPAICDKARRKQCGSRCPNPDCPDGVLYLRQCRGQCGFPVTHFWRHSNSGLVYFQAKGCHDHPAPELRQPNEFLRQRSGRQPAKRAATVNPGESPSAATPAAKTARIVAKGRSSSTVTTATRSEQCCSCSPFDCRHSLDQQQQQQQQQQQSHLIYDSTANPAYDFGYSAAAAAAASSGQWTMNCY